MGLKELADKDTPEQLTFQAFELAGLIASLLSTEAEKKEVMGDFNDRLKIIRKSIARLSAEIESERKSRQ